MAEAILKYKTRICCTGNRKGKVMSIKKIAEKAGVSASTVSRVLNNPNYKCSSPEVRDKIWKIAIELNYTPNTAARNLKMGLKEKKKKSIMLVYL